MNTGSKDGPVSGLKAQMLLVFPTLCGLSVRRVAGQPGHIHDSPIQELEMTGDACSLPALSTVKVKMKQWKADTVDQASALCPNRTD